MRTASRQSRQLAAAYINRLAVAPYPGPKLIDPVIRITLAIVIAVVAFFGLIAVLGISLGTTKQTVDPATVPAGRQYWTSVWDDGRIDTPYVECPNAPQWLAGNHDTFCTENTKTTFIGTGVALTITIALTTAATLLFRSVRRPKPAQHTSIP